MVPKFYSQVLEYATKAHGSQLRKYTNDPYIEHPTAVANIIMDIGGSAAQVYAALLHDVVEDTEETFGTLQVFLFGLLPQQLAIDTLSIVVHCTDVYTKEAFPGLNRKTRKELEAKRLSEIPKESQTVKLADIIHNTDSIMIYDPDHFGKVYLEEITCLLSVMDSDNVLYSRASCNTHQ